MDHRIGICSACGARYKIPATFAPNQARCRACSGVVEIERPPGRDAPRADSARRSSRDRDAARQRDASERKSQQERAAPSADGARDTEHGKRIDERTPASEGVASDMTPSLDTVDRGDRSGDRTADRIAPNAVGSSSATDDGRMHESTRTPSSPNSAREHAFARDAAASTLPSTRSAPVISTSSESSVSNADSPASRARAKSTSRRRRSLAAALIVLVIGAAIVWLLARQSSSEARESARPSDAPHSAPPSSADALRAKSTDGAAGLSGLGHDTPDAPSSNLSGAGH
jgi:hypothetical protein